MAKGQTRRNSVANALKNIEEKVSDLVPNMKGGRRARRAHTRKAAKKAMHGLPRNIKFMGFFTRKQAEKMLRRRH